MAMRVLGGQTRHACRNCLPSSDFHSSALQSFSLVSKARALPNFEAPAFITSSVHSWRGLPTFRTNLPTCGCRVPFTKVSALSGESGSSRATLPKRVSCLYRSCSDNCVLPALRNTSAFETRETKAAGTPRTCHRHLAWKPFMRLSCAFTSHIVANP